MKSSRRWDGKPETNPDKKFFDLRESGYKGPIDQDGDKVTSGRDVEIREEQQQRDGEAK